MDRRHRLDRALDECLAWLLAGASLEECLEAHPDLREELEPLLRSALQVKALDLSGPSPAFRAASPQRLLTRIAESEQAGDRSPWRRFLQPVVSFAGALRAAPLLPLLIAAFLGLFGGSAAIASASSKAIPGDPLYPVKTSIESARLALASSPEERVRLRLAFIETRIQEALELGARGRTEHIATLEERTARLLEETTKELEATATAAAPADVADTSSPAPESLVALLEERRERLQAHQAGVLAQVPEPAKPALERVLQTAGSGLEQAIEAHKDRGPKAGPGSAQASASPPSSPQPSPVAQAPSPSPAAPARHEFRIEGVLQALEEGRGRVNGFTFTIAPSTRIVGRPQPGARVTAAGGVASDGSFLAAELIVQDDSSLATFKFAGALQQLVQDQRSSLTAIVIEQRTVRVSSDTRIEGTLAPGKGIEVRGTIGPNGALTAAHIQVKENVPSAEFELEGVPQVASENQWAINGLTFAVREENARPRPAPTDRAVVQGVIRPNGALEATRIETERQRSEQRDPPPPASFELEGVIEDVVRSERDTIAAITIHGRTIPVAPGNALDNDLRPGLPVRVRGTIGQDGSARVAAIEPKERGRAP